MSITRLHADILVLGSGLAGFSAALAAARREPSASVMLLSARPGASGSSFANPNGALGIHVCPGLREIDDYVAAMQSLAGRASFNPELARIVAQGSEPAFAELASAGVDFQTELDGKVSLFPSCFSSGRPQARLFRNLGQAYDCLFAQAEDLGVQMRTRLLVVSLLHDGQGRVGGALCKVGKSLELVAVTSSATVLALGGPSRLWRRAVAGAGNPGLAMGLLEEVGADMANEGYMQWFLSTCPGGRYWPPGRLGEGRAALIFPDGRTLDVREHPAGAEHIIAARRSHCPSAFSHETSALDRLIVSALREDGTVLVREPDGEQFTRLAFYAHASNGGAVIDHRGRTSVAGLFAAGECATGMHGANRIGGAMVASCLVFGRLAGETAAEEFVDAPANGGEHIYDRARRLAERLRFDMLEREQGLESLSEDLSGLAVFEGRPGLDRLHKRLDEDLHQARDRVLRLALKTARRVTGGMLRIKP